MLVKRGFLGLLSVALNLGAVLFLIPLISLYLNEEAVGVWLLFITLGGVAGLFEFGFYNSILRLVSYTCTGKKDLPKEGLGDITSLKENSKSDIFNNKTLISLLATTSIVYLIMAIFALLFLYLFGYLYLSSLTYLNYSTQEILSAWYIFSLGSVVNLAFSYLNATLHGIGRVNLSNISIIISRIIFIIGAVISLVNGMDIMAISICWLASIVILRVFNIIFVAKNVSISIESLFKISAFSNYAFQGLWSNSKKMAIVNIGAYMISRGSIIVANYILGVEEATKFSLTLSALSFLVIVSTVPMSVMFDKICSQQVLLKKVEIRNLVRRLYIAGVILFLLGSLSILFLSYISIQYNTNLKFVSIDYLLVLIVIFFLEYTHGFSATYLTSKNYIPFVNASIISGMLIIMLNIGFSPIIGLWGIILFQGVVQLSYNNWKWPYEMYKDLKVSVN